MVQDVLLDIVKEKGEYEDGMELGSSGHWFMQ
jgi:hypothetical protein